MNTLSALEASVLYELFHNINDEHTNIRKEIITKLTKLLPQDLLQLNSNVLLRTPVNVSFKKIEHQYIQYWSTYLIESMSSKYSSLNTRDLEILNAFKRIRNLINVTPAN